MARILPILILSILSYSLAIALASATDVVDDDSFVRAVDRKLLGMKKKEKFSHFRFYWHDIYSGHSPTAVPIIPASKASKTGFGSVSMIDDPLTQGPEVTSKLLGRAQGFYAQASQQEVGLLMAMNFVFVTGKYNGSTISILGRNPVFNKVRELPVIGGSGLFRFARGYAHASTHNFTAATGDATVEYNVYLLHY